MNVLYEYAKVIAMFVSQALEEARKTKNRLSEAAVRASTSNPHIWELHAKTGTFISWQLGAERVQKDWEQLLYKIPSVRP